MVRMSNCRAGRQTTSSAGLRLGRAHGLANGPAYFLHHSGWSLENTRFAFRSFPREVLIEIRRGPMCPFSQVLSPPPQSISWFPMSSVGCDEVDSAMPSTIRIGVLIG